MTKEYLPVVAESLKTESPSDESSCANCAENSPQNNISYHTKTNTKPSSIKKFFSLFVWTFAVVIIYHFTIDSIRNHKSRQLQEYVYSQVTTGFKVFADPGKQQFDKMDETALYIKLISDEKMPLEDYEDILERFFMETTGLTDVESVKLFKAYKIRLLSHMASTMKDYNQLDKKACSGIVGCSLDKRIQYRDVLQEDLKANLAQRQVSFLKKLQQIMITTKDQPLDENKDNNSSKENNDSPSFPYPEDLTPNKKWIAV